MACNETSEHGFDPNSVLSQIARGVKYGRSDDFIAVMGVTGSGKSTFISRLVGGGVNVGHGLGSCTKEVKSFTFRYHGRNIHLIDTPGFDDTYRTDSDILKDIAFWLEAAYREKIKLSGIVYLHPIDTKRVTGSALKNLRMFDKLCGDAGLQSVVLATTMWGLVDKRDGERREKELKSTPDFWGKMVSQGSCVFPHDDNYASAMNIVTYILDQRRTTVLQIQREMADGKTLDETSAGKELEKELLKQRENFERRLKEAEEEMKEALEEGNRRAAEEAAEQQDWFKKKLDEALKGSNKLKTSMQKLMEQKDAEYKRVLKDLQAERQRAADESKQTLKEVESMRQKMREREEEAKQSKPPPPYAECTTPSAQPSFEQAFNQSAGASAGEVAGAAIAASGLLAASMVGSSCTVM